MSYSINLTASAINDIQDGLLFYNSRSANLGYRFTEEIDIALQEISFMPNAYGYRYKRVKGKQVKNFPYLIFFIVDEGNLSINVLRIFNGYQEPFYK